MKHLSNKDVEIDNMIMGNVDDIEKLYGHSEKLAIKIQRLKKELVLGINQTFNINNLKTYELDILAGTIKEASNLFDETSEEQKQFANSILLYIDRQYMEVDIKAAIDKIDAISSRRVIAQMLLEYGFLHRLNFEFDEGFETIVDLFEFSTHSIEEIKKSIINIYKLRGVEGFTWFSNSIVEEDTFNLEFEAEIDDLNVINDSPYQNLEIDFSTPKETYEFEKISIISSEEKVVISNKIIDINMILKVHGQLDFINCEIIFEESQVPIQVLEGELNFIYCKISSESNEKIYNFNSDTVGVINFSFCKINNRHNFISGDDLEVNFNDSEIITNYAEFIRCKKITIMSSKLRILEDESNFSKLIGSKMNTLVSSQFRIIENEENFLGTITYQKKYQKIYQRSYSLLNKIFDSYPNSLIFSDEIQVSKTLFDSNIDSEKMKENSFPNIFGSFGSSLKLIKSSNFASLSNIFTNGEFNIIDCKFDNCKEVLNSYNDDFIKVENSLFNQCEKISYGNNIEILGCGFLYCDKVLIIGGSTVRKSYFENCGDIELRSGNTIVDCEFNNIKALTRRKMNKKINIDNCKFTNIILGEDNPHDNFITNYYFDENNQESKIKNSLFENIHIKSSLGYIISTKTAQKIKDRYTSIENCVFINCSANDNLISLEDNYYSKLSNKPKNIVLGSVKNCIGL